MSEELWEAFRAGFMGSVEGWNGEMFYADEGDEDALREHYEEWLEKGRPRKEAQDADG